MKLIIINGPCGVGKSTLSARLHTDTPLAFLLEIDAQRRFISHYREYEKESREMNLAIAKAIIKSCLEDKHDIVMDQMTFDPDILNFYYEIARTYGADVYEIILWAPKETIMKRADERGWREGGLLTPEKCELFWERINELKESRSQAHIINTEDLDEGEVYRRVVEIVNKNEYKKQTS